MAAPAVNPAATKYVCIKGGDLDGKWYPKEWLRDTMASPTAARFVPTGEVDHRVTQVKAKDPVLGDITVPNIDYAFVYAEVPSQKRADPRTRHTCPMCPTEDFADGRRQVRYFTTAQFEQHALEHLRDEGEDPRTYSPHEGSVAEYAMDKGLDQITDVGGNRVEGTAGITPQGGFIGGEGPAPVATSTETAAATTIPDPAQMEAAYAQSLGISVDEFRARVAAPAPVGEAAPQQVDPVAALAEEMDMEVEEILARLTAKEAPSGAEGASEPEGSQTPAEPGTPQDGQQGSGSEPSSKKVPDA